jgi:hypothetical protein
MADEVVDETTGGITTQPGPPPSLNDVEADEQPEDEQPAQEALPEEPAFSWQASEFVHHTKGPGWYFTLVIAVAVLVAAAALLHYWLEVGAFLVMAVAVVVYARKPPRVLMYELAPGGVTIDGKSFPYTEFRSFGVLPEEEWHTIDLEPTKRFRPRMSILYGPDDVGSVVGHLELHLPRVDRKPDVVERLTQYLRF